MKSKGAKDLCDFFKDSQVDSSRHQIQESVIGGFEQTKEERDLFTSVAQFVERNGAFKNYQSFAEEQEKSRQGGVQQELSTMKEKHDAYCVLKYTFLLND